jgi:hypothetical protein
MEKKKPPLRMGRLVYARNTSIQPRIEFLQKLPTKPLKAPE